MKLPLSWLSDYMDRDFSDVKEFCDRMTMSGSKVEGFETLGAEFSDVVVGRVEKVIPHPNSDHMVICQVNVGDENLKIVTGAPNVFEGAYVAVSKIGANLPGGIKIKKSKLRGEDSYGMLCSHDELGLAFSDVPGACENGIICFPEEMNLTLGEDVKKVLDLEETVVEFEITPNRPDCLSVNGLAREVAATFNVPFHMPEVHIEKGEGDLSDYASVTVEAPDLCPRYAAKVVKNVKIGPSPKWMQKRISAAGMRPINNIVDITNYILMEYGQPMHAFDLNYLKDHHIIVRRAKDGEKIKTLDGQDRVLKSTNLVISDPEKALAVAGVMGGFESEITENTETILFESANFFGPSVRRTAASLGLRTDASGKYEKGLDPENVIPAVERACQLVEILGCGEVVDGIIDVNNAPKFEKKIPFDPEKINRFLGMDIPEDFMTDALTRLTFKIEDGFVIVPSYRADMFGEADVAEEVMRMYGYDRINHTLPRGSAEPAMRTPRQKMESKVADRLASDGYYQIMTYSFTDPKLLADVGEDPEKAIKIMNPLGVENSVMRTSIISSLLEILETNYRYRNPSSALFEVGTVYLPKALPLTELPEEKKLIAVGCYGAEHDYFTLKGTVEGLLDTVGVADYSFERAKDSMCFHPGKCADILINGKKAGIIGEIHPDVAERFNIETDVYVTELDFEAVFAAANAAVKYKKIARMPAIERDIAVIVDKDVPVAKIHDVIKKMSGKNLESLTLFDVYEGKQIPEGKKSVAYNAVYRSAEQTLTDNDINKVFDRIVKTLERELGAVLR